MLEIRLSKKSCGIVVAASGHSIPFWKDFFID